jgi:oligopeptide/dipeptide ABC transporter ATP-binding protein
VMYAGQVVEHAVTADLFTRPLHPYTAALLAASPGIRGPADRQALIAGQVPQAGQFPPGCRFHPRCAYAEDACRSEPVLLTGAGRDRQSRCLRVDELSLPGVGSDVAIRLGANPVATQ